MSKLGIPLLTAALSLALLDSVFGQGTLHITFDGPPPQPPGTQVGRDSYSEGGMLFNPIGYQLTRNGGGISGYPENGTAYLQGLGTGLTFSFTDGSVFSLNAVDLAEYSTVFPYPFTVHFVGYRHDGSIVTTDFTTDGIIDGTGPLVDFQTFSFGGQFTGLDRVEIPMTGWSLDNLIVTPIPEPSTLSLVALGGLILGWRFKRK